MRAHRGGCAGPGLEWGFSRSVGIPTHQLFTSITTRSLGKLIEGVDYLLRIIVEQVPHQGGLRSRTVEQILFSLDGLKRWGMSSGTARGQPLPIGRSQPGLGSARGANSAYPLQIRVQGPPMSGWQVRLQRRASFGLDLDPTAAYSMSAAMCSSFIRPASKPRRMAEIAAGLTPCAASHLSILELFGLRPGSRPRPWHRRTQRRQRQRAASG